MLSIITNKVERYVISNNKEYQISKYELWTILVNYSNMCSTKGFLYFRAQKFNKFSFSLYNKNI